MLRDVLHSLVVLDAKRERLARHALAIVEALQSGRLDPRQLRAESENLARVLRKLGVSIES